MAEHLGRVALRRGGLSTTYVSTALARLHTYDGRGQGHLPTTVFLHGLGSAATPFGPVFIRLRRHVRRIVAPDYPGHGFSEHPKEPLTPERLFDAVASALDRLVDEPAVLVGNSLGGAVALRYAITRPSRVRALVLLSPAGARVSDEDWRELKASFDIRTRAQARAFVERIYHEPPWFIPLLAHEFPAAFARRAVRDLLASATFEHAPSPEALASLSMPILLLWGKSERLLPRAHLEWFATHLPPHTIIEEPDGIGHCPHFDAPGVVARRIVRFVRTAA